MIRYRRLVVTLCGAFVLLTGAIFVQLIRYQQEEAIAAYSLNRAQQVSVSAQLAEAEFRDIASALRFTAKLILSTDNAYGRTLELSAYLAVVRQYRMLAVYDAQGRTVSSVVDPGAGPPFEPWRFTELLAGAAQRALRQRPGEILSSRVVNQGGGWHQAFSTTYSQGGRVLGAVALLVDHRLYFRTEFDRVTESRSRLLMLDDYGQPLPGTAEELERRVQDIDAGASNDPEFLLLLQRMRDRHSGTMQLGGGGLWGLAPPTTIVAFAPINARYDGHWAIARLTRTDLIGSELTAISLRLGFIYLLVASLIILLGYRAIAARQNDLAVRQRLAQAEQLAHLHDKTNKILDQIPTGVMSISSGERITALNRWLRDRVPESCLDQPLAAAFPNAPAALLARIERLCAEARADGRVHSIFGEELALFKDAGQYSLHAVPLTPPFPEAQMLLVIEDLSEVRSLASQLLRAEKLATVGVLAAGIAHEVGTPLGIVRGRAEYLLSRLGAEHPQASGARVIVEQIDHVSRTLQQLLDFARVKPAMARTVSLPQVASGVVELLRFEASRRNVNLVAAVPDSLPALAADPDQLQQVLVNLVMNACAACQDRFGSRGGGVVRISASQGDSQDSMRSGSQPLQIAVSDNGAGIPAENRHQVFDPFFTTKKRGQGTGLGLTIVAQIVRNHGGQIELTSETGVGTRVLLRWPTRIVTREERVYGSETHPGR